MSDAMHIQKTRSLRSRVPYCAFMALLSLGLWLWDAQEKNNQFGAGFSLGLAFMWVSLGIVAWKIRHVQSRR